MKRTLSAAVLALALSLALAFPALARQTGDGERGRLSFAVTVEPRYEAAGQFGENGLAPVCQEGKWGYIDTLGSAVIPFVYDRACVFHEGLAVVAAADDGLFRMGFVDGENNYCDFIDPATGQALLLPLDDGGGWDAGSLLFYGGWICLGAGERAALYRTDGRAVPLPEGYFPCGWPVTEGVAVLRDSRDARFYYDLTTGELLQVPLPAQTEGTYLGMDLRPFHGGLAPVAVAVAGPSGTAQDASFLWGFVDRGGRWVIRPQYTDFFASDVNTAYQVFGPLGLAAVCKDGSFGAIDRTGAVVIPFQYDELWPVSGGLMVFLQDGKYGCLDPSDLSAVIQPQFLQISGFRCGLAAVYDGQSAGLIDAAGNAVPGGESLDPSAYFLSAPAGNGAVYLPGEYIVIREGELYGYGHLDYLSPLPAAAQLDDWAWDEVTQAIRAGLVPPYLQNLYRESISRGEFCDVVVCMLEAALDRDVEQLVLERTGRSLDQFRRDYPFLDCSERTVIAASALGIINGYGDGFFGPHDPVTRQQAAVMLARTAKVLGMDTAGAPDAGFRDSSLLADWSREAVNFLAARHIMNGDDTNAFGADDFYSREQAFMTALRLFRCVRPAAC